MLDLDRTGKCLGLRGRLPIVLLLEGERTPEETGVDKCVKQDTDELGALTLFSSFLFQKTGDPAGQVCGLAFDRVDQNFLALRFEIVSGESLEPHVSDVMGAVGQNAGTV